MNIHDLQLHFSIRKLSVGVVSCLIGICFISSNQTVQADSMPIASNNKSVIISNSSSNSNPTETKSNNKQDIVDSNNTSPTQIDSHSNQNSTKSNPTETIASKSNNKQDIVDSNNTSQTQNSRHLSQDSTRTVLVNSKSNVSSQQPATTDSASQQSAADSAKNKLKMATLKTTTDEKLNTKMLAESKATTMQATDTNGGFDSSWGKLDVNSWKGSVQGDYYQLTDYTGDADHIIVPNEADFAKARISTSGKQVGVTSALMHTIFKYKATAKDATVAFSKTNNKMVKAIDSDWSDTWGVSDYSQANLSKFDGTNLDVSNVTDMSSMFYRNQISDLKPLKSWNVSNVTDMRYMFYGNQISDLKPLKSWSVSNVTDMSSMFYGNQISDLSPLANWNVGNVTDMSAMFYGNQISDLSPLANWNVGNVTDMSYMFCHNQISDLSPLATWKLDNVTDISGMFYGNQISDLSPLAYWKLDNVTNMRYMFYGNQISDLKPLKSWSWNIPNVTNMAGMFDLNQISDLSPLANWNVGKVTNMSYMFANNQISDLSPLANWNVGKVTNMSYMFAWNYIRSHKQSYLTNIGDLSKWDTSKVTNMFYMFGAAFTLRHLNISNWDLTNLANKDAVYHIFASDNTLTVIANNLKLPAWYQTEITDAKDVWSNQMAVITNVPELIKSTGAIDNLKIDDQDASRSIFYDSKGSSDAIKVLKDANQAYINKYEQDNPNSKYSLVLDASVDQTDPIALANAKFKTSHKLIDVVQTNNATRKIIVHLPNGTRQTIVQTIGLKRNAQEDLVTEIISSTAPWGLDEANSSFTINGVKQTQTAYKQNSNIITFSSIKLPKLPGYKAKVTRNNGLLLVSYLVFAPEKLEANNNLSELQFSNKLATNSAVQFNSTVKSNIVVKSDMYQVVNDDHNWQLPVIKSYDLKFATNKNQIIFAYTKDKQYNYRFVLTFKDGQYRLTTFDKQGKLLKTYSIKSYKKLAKIIHSLVSMNIA